MPSIRLTFAANVRMSAEEDTWVITRSREEEASLSNPLHSESPTR